MTFNMERSMSEEVQRAAGPANTAPTQFVTAGGVQFAYRAFGAPSLVPLLLCQRFRGTMDDWDPLFLDALAAKRSVIIFDNVGVGRSSGESPQSIAEMADYASSFVGALKLDQIDLLGWSMGGAVAQALTLARPSLVRRLVVAGSGPGGVPGNRPMSALVIQTATKPINEDDDFLYLFFDGSDARREAGRQYLSRLRRRVEPPSPPTRMETIRAMAVALGDWRSGKNAAFERLPDLKQPTLVANGVHDVMVGAYDSFVMSQHLPDAELVLYSDAGHGFLFQHAERFAERVNRFLDSSR
jgi:pimeloyl-ACP methyl ester carboxylesterase